MELSWNQSCRPLTLVCPVALTPPDHSSASSPSTNLLHTFFDLGFLVKWFFHSNCCCESVLLHCPTFSPAFIFQGPSSVIPFPTFSPRISALLRQMPSKSYISTLLLALVQVQFPHWFQSRSGLPPATNESKDRTSGVFPHRPSWTTLGAAQLPFVDAACTHPSLCSVSIHIACCNFLPMGLLAVCFHLRLQQFFAYTKFTRPLQWSLMLLGSSTHV